MRNERAPSMLFVSAAVIIAGAALMSCSQTMRISRGTQIPPELRSLSTSELTELLSRNVSGDRLSAVATLIDFSYVRAVTRERDRERSLERQVYKRYVSRQTSFYVHLILHGRENCRPGASNEDDEDREGDVLRLQDWSFVLRSSAGREIVSEEVETGPTQLAPSGGCLVQGYVHFARNISRNDEWIELAISHGSDRRLNTALRWNVDVFESERPTKRRPTKTPPPDQDDDDPEA